MDYQQKLKKLKKYTAIKINSNKKKYNPQEKSLITRYYKKLEYLGYFDAEKPGYVTVNIEKTKIRVKGAPLIKKRIVEVGTVVDADGKFKTNPRRKVKIEGKKIYVTEKGAPRIWRFEYNIAKNWEVPELAKHIKKAMGGKVKKTQFFAIGAGIKYEVNNSVTTSLERLAREILKIGYRYTPNLSAVYENRGQKKRLSDWMQEIVVYEYLDDVVMRQKSRAAKTKTSRKKGK